MYCYDSKISTSLQNVTAAGVLKQFNNIQRKTVYNIQYEKQFVYINTTIFRSNSWQSFFWEPDEK
jgi:hypothetical protein